MMNGSRKSGGSIVPAKLANTASNEVESVEVRGPAKGNVVEQNTSRTQSRTHGVPSALDRVRRKARQDRKAKFTALLHHVDVDRLRKAYLGLKRNVAPGVVGLTWQQYGEHLEDNLAALHDRLHRGAYRASSRCGCTSPKPPEGSGPWESHRWRTRSFSERWWR